MIPLSSAQIQSYRLRIPLAVENESMARHTTFRIGGAARLYVVAPTVEALVEAVDAAMEFGIPWYVFGGGSNLLVADGGYEGVIIQSALRGLVIEGTRVHAESGGITALVARRSVAAGLSGFAWAAGVPGTIGGAVYGDAGCYGGEMRDVIESVEAYRVRDRQRLILPREVCGFGYRDSIFKHESHVILRCTLALTLATDPVTTAAELAAVIQHRKEDQPLDASSAGCVFKNVEQDRAQAASAGKLIDEAGLKGFIIGDFAVSDKHGNFFVNRGHGCAADVVALIAHVKQVVRERSDIELEEEVQLLGF